MNLDVTQLTSGTYCARPRGSVGTCGFYPFAWTAAFGNTPSEAREEFIYAHKEKIVLAKLRGVI